MSYPEEYDLETLLAADEDENTPEETEGESEIVDISELSPLVMLVRATQSINDMRDWAQQTRNGELMGQAAAGYLEIHDRLAELQEEESREHMGFGFKSQLGEKNGRAN